MRLIDEVREKLIRKIGIPKFITDDYDVTYKDGKAILTKKEAKKCKSS